MTSEKETDEKETDEEETENQTRKQVAVEVHNARIEDTISEASESISSKFEIFITKCL